MLEICLLGATGSIGSQVLDLIREKRDVYRLAAFSFGRNLEKALEIVEEFEPDLVCAIEEVDADSSLTKEEKKELKKQKKEQKKFCLNQL